MRPEPIAPTVRPTRTRISAIIGNDQASTPEPASNRFVIRSSTTALPIRSRRTAASEPSTPQISPSSMNGPRTNQFVAPTSFITSISRRREKIESRIVFAISSADEISRTIVATANAVESTRATVTTRSETSSPSLTFSTPAGSAGRAGSG